MCRRHKHHPRPPKPPVPPTPTPAPPPVSITVAWVNTDRNVSNNDVATWIAGLNAQVPDIQVLWPHVEECHHIVDTPNAPANAVPATIKPTLPEAPGALAYHDVDSSGRPFIVVGSQTCRQAGVSISSAMSHEAVELTVDPSCTLTAKAPNGDVWALEVGDPVQASSYNVTTPTGATVEVSDLVGQSFFGMGAGPLDKTNDCRGPFTVAPGGYAIVNGQSVGEDRFAGPDDDAETLTQWFADPRLLCCWKCLPHRVPTAKFANTQGAPVPVLTKYSKFIAAALTALVAVVAIVFGVDSVVALAVAAAVAPFAVLLAPANN